MVVRQIILCESAEIIEHVSYIFDTCVPPHHAQQWPEPIVIRDLSWRAFPPALPYLIEKNVCFSLTSSLNGFNPVLLVWPSLQGKLFKLLLIGDSARLISYSLVFSLQSLNPL